MEGVSSMLCFYLSRRPLPLPTTPAFLDWFRTVLLSVEVAGSLDSLVSSA